MKSHIIAVLASIPLTLGLIAPTYADEISAPAPDPVIDVAPPQPVIIPAGPKPRDRWDVDKRRDCKRQTRVEKRIQTVEWNLSERYVDNLIFQYWDPQFWTSGWSRVVPAPRGCVLRHREWMRHHPKQARNR